jgi:hypothetical protein
MRSRRTGDEELMVEQVESLGARRLAEIVVNHCHRDERLHQTVRIALAASTPGGTLAKTLATEIDAIRASHHFYGYRESNVLAQEIDRIRQAITEYLLPVQPRSAAELLGRLIRLDANVYERTAACARQSRRVTVRCRFTANGYAIRGRHKHAAHPVRSSDRVEGCGAACFGRGRITQVRTGDTKR